MKFLFWSKDGASLGMALRIAREGHTVKFYCATKEVGRGLIERVASPNSGLEPDTVVVFDAPGNGRRADELRRSGYPVIGGASFIDHVLLTPGYAQQLLSVAGVELVDLGGGAIAADFNGQEWIPGTARMVYRERRFMPGEVGPDIGLAGCTVVYWRQMRPYVFKSTLHKLTRVLREANYVGPVEYDGTLRVGTQYGVFDVCGYLSNGSAGRVLADTARGALRRYHPTYDYGIAVLVTTPPFPHAPAPRREPIGDVATEWFHPYDVCANGAGAVLGLVLAHAPSIKKAREILFERVSTLTVQDLQYRTDVGLQADTFREWVVGARSGGQSAR